MIDEEVVLLFGVCGLGLFLAPLLLVLVLWAKVSRLRNDVDVLQMRVREQRGAAPPIAAAARETASVPIEDIEVIGKPVAPRPITLPTRPRLQPKPPEIRDVPAAARSETPAEAKEPFSLEEVLAGKWLTWVAAIALIIGAGLFFKYSIENQLLGERGRVALGLIVGAAAFAGAAFAMLRDYRWLGQALAGAAGGILYFALFAAFSFYQLIGVEPAFAAMAAVTLALLAFSTIFNAQSTAILGLIGGFLTPMMLSQGQDRQWELFGYIFLLDLGVLGIASFRRWQPLQITAFGFTLLMWCGWFARFYEPAKLQSTLILLTAFFVLFALLGVWHNALRRLPARPGDLFLMMATPVAYFVALYAVTKSQYEQWHGPMAVGLGAVYAAFGAVQLLRNPAGNLAVLTLGGIAASFLTVAIPLQLTGHWIAIAWAAESLLLVELGFKFREAKLRWAGFALLCVVQLILFTYTARTLDNPRSFSTRLTDVDYSDLPILEPIEGEVGLPVIDPPPADPSWTDVFNGRSLSFLASALVMAILAWEYRRRSRSPEVVEVEPVCGWLAALVPITLAGMLSLESFVLANGFHWSGFTLLGLVTAWCAIAALALAIMSATWGPRWLERVATVAFGLVGLLLVCSLLGTLTGWSGEWSHLQSQETVGTCWRWAVINPRGLGFVAAIICAMAAALVCRRRGATESADVGPRLPMSSLLGVFAHLSGLLMLTTEVYAQGVVRNWQTWTALSITLVWLLYALATLIGGIYYRSATIRILALLLFAVTAAKVFLYDVWKLSSEWKTAAFIALGVVLMLVSFFYRRYRDRIRAWVQAAAIAGFAILLFNGTPAEAGEDRTPLDSSPFRWSLSANAGSERRLVGAPLPADLYGEARDDLGDLRVLMVDETAKTSKDVPYLLVRPFDSSGVQSEVVEVLNLSRTDQGTEFMLDLGEEPQTIREIFVDVDFATQNYQHDVSVYGGDRATEIDRLLTDNGLLVDIARGGNRLRVGRIPLPQSRFRFYRVVVHNAGASVFPVPRVRVMERDETRAPRTVYPATITAVQEDSKQHTTIVIADLQHARLPFGAVDVRVQGESDYYRLVQLEVTDTVEDDRSWRAAALFDIYRITRAGHETQVSPKATFVEVRGRYLRLTIQNGDDQPVTVTGITVESIDTWLVCERERLINAQQPIAIYAGDKQLSTPQYDLARTVGEVAVAELAGTATVGPRQANPLFLGPVAPRLPWSEEHRDLVWTLTIGGVALFGGLTALLLWKAAGAPASGSDAA